jgi:hypothetical protein
VLSDGAIVEEITTTVEEIYPYDIQIQGSDRQHPAIVLRRKHRGKGATIQTISKYGQHSTLYADFEGEIKSYIDNRQKRLANKREEPTTRCTFAGGVVETGESWLDKTIQGVVARSDNSQSNTDSI